MALYGAPPKGEPKTGFTDLTIPSNGAVRVIAGPGAVKHKDLPIYAPVKVDYRKSDPALSEGVPPTRLGREPGISVDKALVDACLIDEQCAVCDVCVDYNCETGKCTTTVIDGQTDDGCDDGLYCNGVEPCSSGTCVAGTPPDCATGGDVCDDNLDACVEPCAAVSQACT